MKSFYIASSRDNLDDVVMLAALLAGRGMANAFQWPEHFTHHCSTETCGISDSADLARRELLAAVACDLFIGIARMGKGTHVELGAALTALEGGADKRVILVGVDRTESVFYRAGRVEHAASLDGLLVMLGVALDAGKAKQVRDADLIIAEALEWG